MDQSIHPAWIVIITALLAIVPIVIGLATSYAKISVVLGMIRSALGAQQVPSGLVVMSLSIALTLGIMHNTIIESSKRIEGVNYEQILKKPSANAFMQLAPALDPWKEFLYKHSGRRELVAMRSLLNSSKKIEENTIPSIDEVSFSVLLTSFVITELKEAFSMAFVLLLPFLVIDIIVANILVGMGMFMVSPVIVSLPIKLAIFVLSDGWLLVVSGLIKSYGG